MTVDFPLLWHHMLDGSACKFCPKSCRHPCLYYQLQIPWTLLIGLGHLQSCCRIQFLKQRKVTRSMSLVLCVPSVMVQPPSFLSHLCLCPAPSLSPSNSIRPRLPAFCHLCSNSKVYLCNYATSVLRLALD